MKRFVMAALIAVAAGAAYAGPVTTGSGTVDFTFTEFKGSFAWVDPGFETPRPSLAQSTAHSPRLTEGSSRAEWPARRSSPATPRSRARPRR